MKSCKAELPDGKPCPNQVDDGQEYCFFHLAEQDKELKEILGWGAIFSVTVAGIRFLRIPAKTITHSG